MVTGPSSCPLAESVTLPRRTTVPSNWDDDERTRTRSRYGVCGSIACARISIGRLLPVAVRVERTHVRPSPSTMLLSV
jgi:hypothetical protein